MFLVLLKASLLGCRHDSNHWMVAQVEVEAVVVVAVVAAEGEVVVNQTNCFGRLIMEQEVAVEVGAVAHLRMVVA